jgi:dihydroneopterin aldolase/2-amino-4-hydroxy-6-hydroxymethyldihydropteridine diphosphokinase
MVEDAYVAVGSNIEPENNIPHALLELKTHVIISAISNFYRTSPVGRRNQPDFINGALKIHTDRSPRELKYDILRKIEEKLGRVRSDDKFAPRTIDLDLILYGGLVIDEPGLCLPDPSIRLYPFVAIPLTEVAPELILPDTKTPLADEPIVKLKSDLLIEAEFTDRLRHL